jgi:hypothetical protein
MKDMEVEEELKNIKKMEKGMELATKKKYLNTLLGLHKHVNLRTPHHFII